MSAAAHTVGSPAAAATRVMNAEQAGRRVEEVLDRLDATGEESARAGAEELVRVLMDFYGAGLARIVRLLDAPAAGKVPGSPLAGLLADELVSSLLVLHDLHPEDTATRIDRALDAAGDHSWEVAGFDDSSATLRLRSAGGAGCGCAGTAAASQQAVEDALACFAPEVAAVEVEAGAASRGPALLQIGTAPPSRTAPGPAAAKTR
ncbi:MULTISPECIES: hypothetical protein [unclassified Streptomyces]|uniref:hypothetical protein n=1 Tax=unclassified Streptomyces TaxID=2593676 RepID=UPI002DD9932C|nr:hypothetical protein [Streptomyces sp. NBC_01750]WSA98348.1 hypothetical protein OIE54_03230 [Streptomyces sp. NBC_01794]WSD37114.1 hypothetical protein OG966_37550 [Streptomyces sp. NBC_01750]